MTAKSDTGMEDPADFWIDFARAAVDAGCDAVFGHGPHVTLGIEIYKGRPIFYSLANFFWSDILEPVAEETYEANRELLARAFSDPGSVTDADLLAVWNAAGFDDPRVFQTVIAVCRWQGGRVSEVRLHPVDLGYGKVLRSSGTPRLASPAMAQEILGRLQRISAPYGTRIEIESGIGVIHVR
jgi:poly-gamma-glutamate synthesis protein (capsule biosynthesis protein)